MATLQQLVQAVPTNGSPTTILGLDVLGPGGGPYRLAARDDALVSVRRGLPCVEEAESVIQISGARLTEMRHRSTSAGDFLSKLLTVSPGAARRPAAATVSQQV
jgi:hypothetical protein